MREHLNYLSKDIVNIALIFLFAYLLGSFSTGTFTIGLWPDSVRGFTTFAVSFSSIVAVLGRRYFDA